MSINIDSFLRQHILIPKGTKIHFSDRLEDGDFINYTGILEEDMVVWPEGQDKIKVRNVERCTGNK
jgi:hypothetical protein